MLKHFSVNYLIILNVCIRSFLSPSIHRLLCIGENLEKYNLIPLREKLQATNELNSFENNHDFQQALSAIYSSLLTR
jgi:hypothetical protein